MEAPETVKVMEALMKDGTEARFVGGCVRDAIVNRKVYDIDIATPLEPQEVIRRLNDAGIRHVPTGIKHGTVTGIVDGHPFEITTLRVDVKSHGRHADVEFTDSWEEDAARRDFTMNAIFCGLDGTVYDAFGGVEDLREGRVRFVGDPRQRIEEDVLRILRFFRFHAHFGRGGADAGALKACADLAKKIPSLSAERIRQEFLKLLESDRSSAVIRTMTEEGVLSYVLPCAPDISALIRLIGFEEMAHAGADVMRRLSALTDRGGDMARKVAERFRLSGEQAARLELFSSARRDIRLDTGEAELRRLIYRLGNDAVRSLVLIQAAAEHFPPEIVLPLYREATRWKSPRFPIHGADVLALGLPPGPRVGEILGRVEDWWIKAEFRPGRTECLDRLTKEIVG